MINNYLLKIIANNFFLSKLVLIGLFFSIASGTNIYSQETLAEKLGYKKDAKLLLIHTDDLGIAHSENIASFKALDDGSVNSASVIMPGPWVNEVVSYAKINSGNHDLGIHLAITSEWKNYKWGPVASKDKVPSLINEHGYFFDACPPDANVTEVEIELRAQIELALSMGIEPTHLDSHMGCLFWGKVTFFEVYLKLAREYNLPCLVGKTFKSLYSDNEDDFNQVLKENNSLVVLDNGYSISPEEYAKGSEQYYVKILETLESGLTQIIIHTAYDNEEMQGITLDHPDWGAAWRQADFDFFTSDTCKNLLEKENIILVTWKEIGEVLTK